MFKNIYLKNKRTNGDTIEYVFRLTAELSVEKVHALTIDGRELSRQFLMPVLAGGGRRGRSFVMSHLIMRTIKLNPFDPAR